MTLGSHQRTIGVSQVHITPRWILDPLGSFDLDPCASDPRPWDCAAVFGRVVFHKVDGSAQTTRDGKVANSGAPVVLAAFGRRDADVLAGCSLRGQFVPLLLPRVVVALSIGPTWREAVIEWLRDQDGPVSVADLYRAFARHPKAQRNPNWKPKLRQTLQRGAGRRVGRDQWVAV